MFYLTKRVRQLWAIAASVIPLGFQAAAPTNGSAFYHRTHAFGLSALQLRYEYLLSETVFAGFPANASLAFYALPSFVPEHGVWMHPHGKSYLVVSAHAQTNLWQWSELDRLRETGRLDVSDKIEAVRGAKLIEFQQRELPAALGKKVENAWHRAVFGVKGDERQSGLDGVTFVFKAYSKENGQRSWDAWSPPSNSLAAQLAAVALALEQFCENGSTQALETALTELKIAATNSAE